MADPMSIEHEIVAALRRIIRAVDLHSRHLMQEVGLTWPQLATLRTADELGPCSITSLARAVHLGQATLTGIVQRLERAGYIQRSPHETDGRSVRISVTSAGREVLSRAPSLLQDRFHQELGRLKDWERYQTLASLQRIAAMMHAEALDASPMLVAGPVEPTTPGVESESACVDAPAEPARRGRKTGPGVGSVGRHNQKES
jgi:DNA-binding MarR family transcriptional regulator